LAIGEGLAFFLMNEKTGRRFWSGGGELFGTGDDGGLDRGASSDHTAGEYFGLDVGGSEGSQGLSEVYATASMGCVAAIPVSVVSGAHSTRLRFAGGSSSYNERFCRE